MIAYMLRPKARSDIEAIADYTFENWGAVQEELYLRLLKRSLESLGENPELGRSLDEVIPGLRRLLAGQHIILYFIGELEIDVVRILHQSMDIAHHFDD